VAPLSLRTLLFGYYTKPFLRQQVNWTAKLPESIKETLSEELKERLGLYPHANVGRTGDLRYLSVQYPKEDQAEKVEYSARLTGVTA
jgi:fumagillin biosynthesis dioxygenase